MHYPEVIKYLYNALPMYQRIGKAAYKTDLNNTIALCELLNNPQDTFLSIHIAGTNGKGSVANMLASVFQQAGYKTGLYTSPHLKDFRERIRINGNMIPKQYVGDFVNKYKSDFEKIGLSFFEMTVGLAFDYFKNQNIDIAILETGMGGRLDSTNIVKPKLSIITNIDLDHTQFLGNTIKDIATEKAGIIKPKIPVVIGKTNEKAYQVFIDKANKLNASIVFADKEVSIKKTNNKLILKTKQETIDFYQVLKGHYQLENYATAFQALSISKTFFKNITNEIIKKGFENIYTNTFFSGRWQIISKFPLIIADTGHNMHAIKQIISQLKNLQAKKYHIVWGSVNDKNIIEILKMLPQKDDFVYYFCKPDIPRGLDVDILYKNAKKIGLQGNSYPTVTEAYNSAKNNAAKEDIIFVGGSTFVVAEI